MAKMKGGSGGDYIGVRREDEVLTLGKTDQGRIVGRTNLPESASGCQGSKTRRVLLACAVELRRLQRQLLKGEDANAFDGTDKMLQDRSAESKDVVVGWNSLLLSDLGEGP